MQRACALFGLDAVLGEQGAIDIVAERLGLGRDQIASDPFQIGHPRNSPGALVIRRVVDEEGLDRSEEHRRGVTHALRSRLALDTDGAAQLLQDEFVAGRFFAAKDAAFEFGDQHGARLWLQRPQKSRSRSTACPSLVIRATTSVRKASPYL